MSTVKGIKKTIDKLNRLKNIDNNIEQITEGVSSEIALNARAYAPKDLGALQQSIISFKTKDNTYAVEVGVKYGAYMEFGTGGKVQVPDELREVAIRFKGKGVKQVNIRPQPYLYPAFVKGRRQYLEDLEDLLKQLTK